MLSLQESLAEASRLASGLRSFRWIVKLSGTSRSSSFSAFSRSAETAVSTSGLFVRSSSAVPTWVEVSVSNSPRSILANSSLWIVWSRSRCSALSASTSSGETTPSLTRVAA